MNEVETFLGAGNVGGSEAAQAVEDATAPQVTPAEGEQKVEGEIVKANVEGKELDLNKMEDEQFEKFVARLVSDPKSPFHNNPAWQRIIGQRNQSTKKADMVFARYAQKDPQGAMEMLLDDGMDEQQAQEHLSNLGIDLNVRTETKPTGTPKVEVDDLEFIKLLKGMNVDYSTLSPEQLEFWKFQHKFNRQMMEPMDKFIQQNKTEKERAEVTRVRSDMEKEEGEVSKLAKDKYGLDWEKEVVPELLAYLKQNPKFIGTPKQLFREVFFDRIEDLGKRAKTVEDTKLNEEKKRSRSEDGGSSGGETKPAGVGKNFQTTWDYLNNKYK